MRIPAILAVTTTIFLALASSTVANNYSFQIIADDSGPNNGIEFNYFTGAPSVNDNGLVAFRGSENPIAPVDGVYTGTGTTITRILKNSDYLESEQIGELNPYPSINNNGTVAVIAGGGNRIITGDGTTVTELYDQGTTSRYYAGDGVPINSSGTVAFSAQDLGESYGAIYTGSGGPPTLIRSGEEGPIASPMINDNGDLAWYADGGGMYIHKNGTTHLVAEQVLYPAGTAGNINSEGVAAFTASPIPGGIGSGYITAEVVETSPGVDETRLTTVVDSQGRFDEFNLSAIEYNEFTDEQLIAFVGTYDSGSIGLFTGPSITEDKVIAVGDTLFEQEVTNICFYHWGLNSSGQVAFSAALDDGDDGRNVVVLATPVVVPEPATLSLLVLGGLAILIISRTKRR